MAKNETEIQQQDVEKEHMSEVHVGPHWAYVLGVLLGSFLLMVGLIALLGAGA